MPHLAFSLIGAGAAAIDRPAAIAAGDPLAVAPDTHGLHQSLMLKSAATLPAIAAPALASLIGPAPSSDRKQKGQNQPNQRFVHVPSP